MKQVPSKKEKSNKKNPNQSPVTPSIHVTGDKVCITNRSMQAIVVSAMVICLLVFLVYRPALNNDFVNWDDDLYVYNNANIRSLDFPSLLRMFTEFNAGLWLPLTWLSHATDYAFWKLDPFGHHLTSIILHMLNTLTAFFLFIRLIIKHKENYVISKPPTRLFSNFAQVLITAGIAALLFGIHPLRVESVVWAAERKDVLCVFFFLLSTHFYISYASATQQPHRSKLYIIVLLLFIMALMAKPMAVTLPAVLLLLDIFPLRRIGKQPWKHVNVLLEKIPFFIASIGSSVITILAQGSGGAIKNIDAGTRVVNAVRSLVFYIEKMVWPFEMAPFYPLPKHINFFDPEYLLSGIVLLTITGACLWMFQRGNLLFLTVWSYYVITLLPVLGITQQVGWQAAGDRFTYLPSISLSLVFGIGITWARQKVACAWPKKNVGDLLLIFPFITIALFGYLTLQQITVWRNSEIMWNHVLSISPNTSVPYNNLGIIYAEKGMLDKAISNFKKALSINPRHTEAHSNLGTAYAQQGKVDDAIAEFKQALAINPHFLDANRNLVLAYYNQGKYNLAVTHLNEAMKLGVNVGPDLLKLLKPYH